MRLKPDLAEVMLADAYFEYWVKRDYDGAKVRFEKLSAKWPNNADVLTALASIARRQGRWEDGKTYFERAVAIDPLRPGRRLRSAELSFATRDFTGALSQLDASLQYWPDAPDNVPFIAKKAAIYQALGRLDDAAKLLEGLELEPDGEVVEPFVVQAALRRRPEDAIGQLETLLARDAAQGSPGRASIDLNLYLAKLRSLAGDASGANVAHYAALDELRLLLEKQPDNADIHSYLALAYCGLGDRAQATKHAAIAVAAVPVEKDALSGAYYLDVQARVWARLGDPDAAIPAIERLMNLPAPSPLTPALLRLDPDFDKLRADARFKALLDGAR
jgi:tetratricopeptide (TPR) repeat protein